MWWCVWYGDQNKGDVSVWLSGLLQADIVWAMVVECVVLCWIIAMPTWSIRKLARRVSRGNACAKVPELLVGHAFSSVLRELELWSCRSQSRREVLCLGQTYMNNMIT